MQKPKPTDFDNEQDYLNNWAGWQVQSGSWSEPVPTDWKAPVVTPQPDGMLTNTTTPTEDTYTAPPTDYVPEYVQPKTTQVEDLFSNELGSSTEVDDPFAIDVESEDTYTAPPADYVPEYTAPVNAATGYREDGDVSSSPASEDLSNFEVDYGDMDLSSLGTEGKLGDYTPEQFTEFQRETLQKQLDEYGLSFEDIGDKTFEDYASDETMETFHTDFQPFVTKRNQESRDELFNLYGTDDEAFNTAFESADVNAQLNFANTLYKEGTLDKETYTQVAAQALQRKNPNLSYFVDDGLLYSFDTERFGDNAAGAEEVILFDDQFAALAGTYGVDEEEAFKRRLGETNFRDPTDDDSTWVNARDKVIKPLADAALSILSGGMSDVVKTAIKGASGETLHGEDWAVLTTKGLEMAGVITAPTEVVDPNTGEIVKTAGKGLSIGGLNLSYEATTSLINGLGEKNPVAVMTSLMGDKWPDTLKGFGIPATLVDDPDFMKAFNKGLNVALDGGSLEDVLTESVEKYIKEGGSFGDLLEGDYDVSMFDGLGDVLKPFMDVLKEVAGEAEDLLKPVVDVIADAAEPIINTADDILDATGDVIGDTVDVVADTFEPVINTADDILDATGDVIGDTVDVVADTFEPIINTADDILDATGDVIGDTVDVLADAADPLVDAADDIIDATGDVIDDTVDVVADTFEPVVDAADDIIDATGDTLEDLADALPDVPDVPLPDLNLDLNLPSMGMLSGTRTTDSLFGKDLFKFKTKIGVSPQEQLMQAPQRKQQKQEYDNLFEDPFASTFNFKV